MFKVVVALVLAAVALGFDVVRAAPESPSGAVSARQALAHFVDNVHTLTADFTQVQTDDTGKVVKTQSGQVWLERPGKFRWNYEKPYRQTIVCDGKKIWVYDPDLQQVTVRPAGEALAGSPAALLSGRSTLTQAYMLEDGGMSGGLHLVKMVPKSRDGDFKSITLSLRKGVPVRMVFRDQLGDATDIAFSHVATNRAVGANRFAFTPPKGTTVVGADAPDTD